MAYGLSRRVGGAVVRNRIRRRLRAVFALIEQRHEAGTARFPNGTYLVSASAAAAHVPFDELVHTAEVLLAELDAGRDGSEAGRHGGSR